MFKKLLLGIPLLFVVAVIVFVVAVVMQPEDFKIARTATIAAPPEKVFEQINDFRKWDAWSPWAKIDPAMKVTYSGTANGVGSVYDWVGNSDAGQGKMTITESRQNEYIAIDLEFVKPFAAKNLTEFAIRPEGDKTNVTWTMSGKNEFVGKAFGLMMDMDKMIGSDFEKGLSQMKTVVETPK